MHRTLDRRDYFWPVVALVVAADLLTKLMAQALIPRAYTPEVLGDWVRLTLLYNPGAAFGLHLGAWSRWAFFIIAIVAVVVLVRMYWATSRDKQTRIWALALLTGGAGSNAFNRVWSSRGVVDFIDVGIGNWRWPAFNLADASITTGAILLAWVLWREDTREDDSAA